MKKRGFASFLLALTLLAGGCAAQSTKKETLIVTSFYPMYIFTQNVADGIEGVKVVNMADQSVGCLHDYQLQTRDMVMLEDASALVINGGGMEQFMDKVIDLRADLPVIDAGEGIEMLESGHTGDGEQEHGEEHAHEHELHNAHIWLDPQKACMQVENIARGLALADPQNADAYRANAVAYVERIKALDAQLGAQLAPLEGKSVVIFHEAFVYFAQAYGLNVAGIIEHEPGEEPGTREIAQTCDLVKQWGISALLIEPQYPARAAETIARETGALIYSIDPMVSGDGAKDSYERVMHENAATVMEALIQ